MSGVATHFIIETVSFHIGGFDVLATSHIKYLQSDGYELDFKEQIWLKLVYRLCWTITHCSERAIDLSDFDAGCCFLYQDSLICYQATSHYLSQCWIRSLSPYGVTRPQWEQFEAVDLSCILLQSTVKNGISLVFLHLLKIYLTVAHVCLI